MVEPTLNYDVQLNYYNKIYINVLKQKINRFRKKFL